MARCEGCTGDTGVRHISTQAWRQKGAVPQENTSARLMSPTESLSFFDVRKPQTHNTQTHEDQILRISLAWSHPQRKNTSTNFWPYEPDWLFWITKFLRHAVLQHLGSIMSYSSICVRVFLWFPNCKTNISSMLSCTSAPRHHPEAPVLCHRLFRRSNLHRPSSWTNLLVQSFSQRIFRKSCFQCGHNLQRVSWQETLQKAWRDNFMASGCHGVCVDCQHPPK